MKKRGIALIIIIIAILLFCLMGFIFAETTFFEGETGYGGDFIMSSDETQQASLVFCGNGICDFEEGCLSCSGDCGICSEEEISIVSKESAGGIPKTYETEICDLMFSELKTRLSEKNNLDYTSEEISQLSTRLNDELKIKLSEEKVRDYVVYYEDRCASYLPLISRLSVGRYRDLVTPTIIASSVIILIFFVYILLRIVNWTKHHRKQFTKENRRIKSIKNNKTLKKSAKRGKND